MNQHYELTVRFLGAEFDSLFSYLKKNWKRAFFFLALGLLIFWTLVLNQTTIDSWVQMFGQKSPPLELVLVFEWLVLLSVYKKSVSLWSYYRKSYFVSSASLSWVDAVLLSALSPLYWLVQLDSLHGFFTSYWAWSLLAYAVATYAAAYVMSVRDFFQLEKLRDDKYAGKTILYSDEPIDDDSSDLIGRKNFAQALKENIYNLSFKESFVMALYGKWGEGKTSILNLLKKDIRHDNRLMIYEFDPWFYGDESALTTNFYRGLEDLLQESYFIPRKIKRLFRFYPQVLLKGLASVGLEFNSNDEEDRPIELKKAIESFVAGLDKRVLVVIDDIDRLQREEILALFRLIKLTSHIKNLVFLISLDASRVSKILKSTGDFEDPLSYIEKIVQLPINLPMTDQSKVDRFILFSYPAMGHVSEIDKLFDRMNLDTTERAEFDKEFTSIYQSHLRPIFSTYRAAKRYMNSILFRLPFIEREVYLYDFFIIEVIQTFYPELYADMKSSPWYYLSSRWSFESIVYSPLPYDEKERHKAVKEHLEEMIKNLPHTESVRAMLESIFPDVANSFSSGRSHMGSDSARIHKRISHPECYAKYFMLGTREGLISDAEFSDMLAVWVKSSTPEYEIRKSFFEKYQKEFKLIQLFERLKLHSAALDSKLILPLIKVIIEDCRKLQRGGDLFQTEFDQADGLLFRLTEDRKDVIPDKDIQPLLENAIEKAAGLDLASLIVLTCSEGHGNSIPRVHTNADVNKLREALDKRLTAYLIEGKKNIFDEYSQEREFAFILYQWATNWGISSDTLKVKVSDYLIGLFASNPSLAVFFLRHFVKDGRFYDDKKYFDYTGFAVAYDADKFATYLEGLGESILSLESDREVINLFLEKHRQTKQPVLQNDQG